MSNSYLRYPFTIGHDGKIDITNEEDHIRDMIEQCLFTSPGERVDLLEFGCGLRDIIFSPNSEILAAITRITVTTTLQKWLGTIIRVNDVQVTSIEEKLHINISYTIIRTREKDQLEFIR